jgi:DNA processing protein
MVDELRYWLALYYIKGLGQYGVHKLLSYFGSIKEILNADSRGLKASGLTNKGVHDNILAFDGWDEVEEQLDLLVKYNAQLVPFTSPEFPVNLKSVRGGPLLLFVRGSFKPEDQQAIGIVGTRRPTRYGQEVTSKLAGELARAGMVVVSGMARGIDTVAHRAALAAGQRTIAVLGCGVDVIYPPENTKTMKAIIGSGAVVSEYPMGTGPDARHFPRRNRIISGLSQGVIVIEAPEKSGALLTAQFAREQKRMVFGVPGNIQSGVSKGTNKMIREGALLVSGADDVLEALGRHVPPKGPEPAAAAPVVPEAIKQLDPEEQQIYSALSADPIHVDTLVQKVKMPSHKILAVLLPLELNGLVEQQAGKMFVRK